MGASQANDSGLSTKFEAACIPDSQAHDRGVAPESRICLCDARLVNLLFIAAGNVSVVCQWERFLLQDCVIEHRFLSGEKQRGHKVDGQCQSELYCKRYSGIRQDRDFQLSHRGGNSNEWHTHPEKVCSVLTPTCIFVFMPLMSPGIVDGTETIIAAAARQFSNVIRDRTHDPRSERKTYNTICIPVPSMRLIHCGNVDMPVCATYEPIPGNKAAISFEAP
jgi:hypothetical protein